MSCVAAGSGVARAGFVDASNDSVPVFETLSNRGVSVKSSGGSGLPAFEYEMFSVPQSACVQHAAVFARADCGWDEVGAFRVRFVHIRVDQLDQLVVHGSVRVRMNEIRSARS